MAQKKKAAHRTSPALVLLIAALVIFLGIELIQVGQRLSEARQQQAALERQLPLMAELTGADVFLDCITMDDALVQYLIDVLKRRDWKEFYKLSQITTRMDLDPEEFLYWLGHREDYASEEERVCAAVMDACLLRLAQERRLDAAAALLSGDRKTFEAFRCEAPELVHLPAATFEWYEKNYLNRDYPIRFIMRLNGVVFPDEHTIS